MLKIRKFILCLCVFSISLDANAITINEALISAYKTNSKLNAQREILKASDEQIMQALSRWLPTISATVTKQYRNQKSLQRGPASNLTTTNTSNGGVTHGLTISQNLFRSGADIARIKAARATIEAARANLESKEQEIFINTAKAYMNALSTKEIYHIAQHRETDSEKLLRGTRHRFKAGDTSKTDVALAEANYENAIADKMVAKANYESAKASFKAVTDLEAKNLILPKTIPQLPKSLNKTIDTAITKNPSMIAAKNAANAQKQNIGVVRGSVLPSVDLQHTIAGNIKTTAFTSTRRRSHTTAIILTIPIFGTSDGSGKNSWSALREQKHKAAQLQNELQETMKNTKAGAIQSWAAFKAGKRSLKAREAQYAAQKIAYKGAQALEKAGQISTLDMLDFQKRYFNAYSKFIAEREKYYNAFYILKSTVGECTAKGLGLNTQYYDLLKNYNSIKWQLIGAF